MTKAKGSNDNSSANAEMKKSKVKTAASSGAGPSASRMKAETRKTLTSTSMSDVAAQLIDTTTSAVKEEIKVLDRLNPIDVGALGSQKGSTPADIVIEAANILSDELKRGFDTASNIGNQLGKGNLGSITDQEVVEQFRNQAHSMIDTFVNLVNIVTVPVNDLADVILPGAAGGEGVNASSPSASVGVPSFSVSKTASPGGKIELSMALENERGDLTEKFDLFCSDLQSPSGDKIGSDAVSFNPRTVVLAPRKSKKVKVLIEVPAKASTGTYSGLIQSTEEDGMRAVLSFRVV